jgi:predicted DNA-binding transcriptional regulator AlpA
MPTRPEVTRRRVGIGHNNPPEAIDDPSALLTKRNLAELLAVNPWTLDRWRKRDSDFPDPLWISGTTPRWRRTDVERWLESRPKGGLSPEWNRSTTIRRRRRRRISEVDHG